MDEDNSYEALMNPGEANNFFDITNLPELDPSATNAHSRTNSLWLIEFSRLIYRQEGDEKPRPPQFRTRNQFLAPKGWQEIAFFNKNDTQAGLLVNDKLKCAALVFRGTLGLDDAITDAKCVLTPWEGSGLVHDGFKAAFNAAWGSLIKPKLLALGMPFFITGHSLGAALGTLAAARCLQDKTFKNCRPLALYTFGSPRVGDRAFGADLKGIFHCRIVNDEDIVTTVPPAMPLPLVPVFQHVGQLHRIEPDGHLHIFPADTDGPEARSPRTGALNLVKSLGELLGRVRTSVGGPPEPLRDHTPVNYTARLERAS